MSSVEPNQEFDVIVVGGGFSGLYALHRLRGDGLRVRLLEAGPALGGVWFHNRYPGARCDVESADYSYSFSPELDQEWSWSERFSPQADIERYINFVADRFDLRRDIQLDTRVAAAHFDEVTARWLVTTAGGESFRVQYVVMATGQLSEFRRPALPGAERFRGERYDTGHWPTTPVPLAGKRVGVIGTGSSAIQLVPAIAEEVAQLVVLQRTPNFSIPAGNKVLDEADLAEMKATYPQRRIEVRSSPTGNIVDPTDRSALADDAEGRRRQFGSRWGNGAFSLLFSYNDLMVDPESNATMTEFLQDRIREAVTDPAVAEALVPTDHPAGSKRLCVDSGYYQTFNRPNVRLVNLRETPLEEVTETGVRTSAEDIELDVLIYATGFDAFTGALSRIDIRAGEVTLAERWAHGPRAHLGLMVHGLPNLFVIAGPGSPSVLGNVIHSAEQHVDWTADLLAHLRAEGLDTVAPTLEAEDAWCAHVAEVADSTLYTKTTSWYLGSNVPGKPRTFMAYLGGTNGFRRICDEIAADGYRGFTLSAVPALSEAGA